MFWEIVWSIFWWLGGGLVFCWNWVEIILWNVWVFRNLLRVVFCLLSLLGNCWVVDEWGISVGWNEGEFFWIGVWVWWIGWGLWVFDVFKCFVCWGVCECFELFGNVGSL